MRLLRNLTAALLVLAVAMPAAGHGGDDHKEWIDVLSWSWGMSNGSASVVRDARVQFLTRNFVRDAEAGRLRGSGKVVIVGNPATARALSRSEAVTLNFEKFSIEGATIRRRSRTDASGSVPTEKFSLNYEQVRRTYDKP